MSTISELARELGRAGRRSGRRISRVGTDAVQRTAAEIQDLMAESGHLVLGAVRAKADELGLRDKRF
ncbi:hypothetical protein HLB23_00230 [Nocardia uniformis]|uniref:Uncharacterized protein n=1 Tax=Nocardia uniformis TaxID=53432 RepID=A0A849BNP1_9NOCA|nr:hypothetical protein [Nocardia uniformis]NNH68322.1 hypothetical protein [Nocardia uniformis]